MVAGKVFPGLRLRCFVAFPLSHFFRTVPSDDPETSRQVQIIYELQSRLGMTWGRPHQLQKRR